MLPLLLTATVTVRDASFTRRTDPAVREHDYRLALTRWIAHPAVRHIVFCENSGFPLERFSDLAGSARDLGKHLELISFHAPAYPPHKGKGYGEMLILEHALAHSAALASAPMLLKITGRYYVPNASPILLNSAPALDVLANLSRNLARANSAVFCATPGFLRDYLFPLRDAIDDASGIFLEHVLARAIHKALAGGRRWSPLPVEPEIRGVSGTSGVAYPSRAIGRLYRSCLHSVKRFAFAQ